MSRSNVHTRLGQVSYHRSITNRQSRDRRRVDGWNRRYHNDKGEVASGVAEWAMSDNRDVISSADVGHPTYDSREWIDRKTRRQVRRVITGGISRRRNLIIELIANLNIRQIENACYRRFGYDDLHGGNRVVR